MQMHNCQWTSTHKNLIPDTKMQLLRHRWETRGEVLVHRPSIFSFATRPICETWGRRPRQPHPRPPRTQKPSPRPHRARKKIASTPGVPMGAPGKGDSGLGRYQCRRDHAKIYMQNANKWNTRVRNTFLDNNRDQADIQDSGKSRTAAL